MNPYVGCDDTIMCKLWQRPLSGLCTLSDLDVPLWIRGVYKSLVQAMNCDIRCTGGVVLVIGLLLLCCVYRYIWYMIVILSTMTVFTSY